MSNIQLGPVTFIGHAGERWVFSELTDWFGQVGDKEPRTKRPQRHGDFASLVSTRDSRAISFKAFFNGTSTAQVEDAYDALSAVGAEGPVLMTVTADDGRSSWRRVKVDSIPMSDPGARPFGEATIHVIAEDPRRYVSGEWLSTPPPSPGQGRTWPSIRPLIWPGGGSSGRIELVNNGRAPSAPVFRLGGAFASALITCVDTGARVGLDRPVPAGSFVEIDFSTRRAMLDGLSDVSRWLRFREWTEVPGLMPRTYQFDATEPVGAVMQGMVNHAWW